MFGDSDNVSLSLGNVFDVCKSNALPTTSVTTAFCPAFLIALAILVNALFNLVPWASSSSTDT